MNNSLMGSVLDVEQINGWWISPIQYQMYSPRTRKVRLLLIPGADDPTIMDEDEVGEYVSDAHDWFRDELDGAPDFIKMDRPMQQEFGKNLIDIRISNKERAARGGTRKYISLGGVLT